MNDSRNLRRAVPALAGLGLALACAVSCVSREDDDLRWFERAPRTTLSVVVDDTESPVTTKSILTDPNIETKLTSLTVAIYNEDGSRFSVKDYTGGFDALDYTFEPDATYRVYAVANMGAMSSVFPSTWTEASMANIVYTIPGYTTASTGVNARGIPMAGSLLFVAGTSPDTVIPLTRLLAKLEVDLECTWPGDISSVKVKNLNSKLRPFGTSAATSYSDILAEQEIEVPATLKEKGTFVFYVPENRQGTVSGITDSRDKKSDGTGSSNPVNAKSDIASYLEVLVTGRNAYSVDGTITFRSYLGNNATSDFNIVRNNRYAWTIKYRPDGMTIDDWKHDNDLSWTRYRYTRNWPAFLYLGESRVFGLYCYRTVYDSGVVVVDDEFAPTRPDYLDFTWEIDPSSRLVYENRYGADYYFRGVTAGSVHVRQVVNDGYVDDVYEKDIQVLNLSRQLFLRTPVGDLYPSAENADNPHPVMYGTTWEVKIGMKKTTQSGESIICPVVCGSDNNETIMLRAGLSPSSLVERFNYSSWDGGTGHEAKVDITFDEKTSFLHPYAVNMYTSYEDYGGETRSLSGLVYFDVLDDPKEVLNISADRESALISAYGGRFELTATSATVSYGVNGPQTDITSNSGYSWTVSPSSTSSVVLSGGKRVVTSSVAGNVTVTVTKNGDPSVTASKVLTFDNKSEYRLRAYPSSITNLKVGDVLTQSDFYFYKELWVNDVYAGDAYREVKFSGIYWMRNTSSDSNYLTFPANQQGGITAKAEGHAQIKAFTYDQTIAADYRESVIDVVITSAVVDTWTLELSPSTSTKNIGQVQTYTATVKKNGVAQTVSNSDISWKTSSGSVAEIGASIGTSVSVTARAAGSATITATYNDGYASHTCSGTATMIVSADTWTVEVDPSSAAKRAGETQAFSATVKKNGTPQSVAASTISWDIASGATYATVNSSTGVATAVAPGTATVRASFNNGTASAQGTATLTVTDADYDVTISPSAGVDLILGKKTVQSYSASATKNGVPDTAGSYEWSVNYTTRVSLAGANSSSVTVTAAAAGDVTLTVNYKVGGNTKASSSVSFTVYENLLTLSLSPTSISVNSTTSPTTLFISNGTPTHVTPDATYRAYTSATGTDLSDKVSISGMTIRGAKAGECWIEASYSTGGYTYTSERVKLTVSNNPLVLDWSTAGIPTIVGQRGLVELSGLDDPSATVTYAVQPASMSSKVRIVKNGNNAYVELLGSAATGFTVTASATNGQEGSVDGSGIIVAPTLVRNVNTVYANPDGSEAMYDDEEGSENNQQGLYGVTLSPYYRSGTNMLTVTSGATATGTQLHAGLYAELLEPQYVSDNSLIHAGTDGIWATDVYESLSPVTLTISPKGGASTGVSSTTATVKGVDPFHVYYATPLVQPDEDDFGLVNMYRQYKNHTYQQRQVTLSYPIWAHDDRMGMEIFRNGSILPSGAVRSCFTITRQSDYNWKVSYQLSESALSEHVGGLIELKAYVRNAHSGNRMYKSGAQIGVYVNGAIGAKMDGTGTSTVKITTAFPGAEESHGFGQFTSPSVKLIGTSYHAGDPFSYIGNTTVQNVPADGAPLGGTVYELHCDGGTLDSEMAIMEAEQPRFKFKSIEGLGVFVQGDLDNTGFYYLTPTGTATIYDNSTGKIHGFYKLHLLGSIVDSPVSGPKAGWVLD